MHCGEKVRGEKFALGGLREYALANRGEHADRIREDVVAPSPSTSAIETGGFSAVLNYCGRGAGAGLEAGLVNLPSSTGTLSWTF